MKKLLVACGNGIATSTIAAVKIREACEEKKIPVAITQCKILEVLSKAEDYDLIVTTGKFQDPSIKTPIFSAISLLTGIGAEETIEKITDFLSK